MRKNSSLPIIAISACLTGQAVRYDGGHKYTPLLIETLSKHTTLLPVCPETAIGLSVPRNKIQLTYKNGEIRVLDTINPQIDLSDLLHDYALQFLKQYQLSGLILQEKSPSCGIDNCKTFADNGEIIAYSSGIFAATVMNHLPELPRCCAIDLRNHQQLSNFIKQVEDYHSNF
ncbi:MAG: DUF523 domain-containing protein [Methylococcaceae bacterium]|nr:DUF523 domain-containing protein [Methylococcaceae bacterium]